MQATRFDANWNFMNLDILIFHMDGGLIDVLKSHRKTIQRTVQIYLESCLAFEKRGRSGWITDGEISLFKTAGGFNNDWDLISRIFLYLLSASGIPPLPNRQRFSSIPEIVSYLGIRSSMLRRKTTLRSKRKQLLSFLEKVKSKGGGSKGIGRILGAFWEGWVYRVGDLDRGNLVKRIFQEVYLGRMFTRRYRLRPIFYIRWSTSACRHALRPKHPVVQGFGLAMTTFCGS